MSFPDFDLEYPSKCYVKVCGVVDSEELQACVGSGADAIGFSLTKSGQASAPGYLSESAASELVRILPAGVTSVLLVHSPDYDVMARAHDLVESEVLQVRQPAHPIALSRLRRANHGLKVIKTIGVTDGAHYKDIIQVAMPYLEADSIDAVLLDSHKGGSGQTHDWTLSRHVVEELEGLPIILAGGLTPRNVGSAIDEVRPYAVDVMSGVSMGHQNRKDPALVSSFVRSVRRSSGWCR